MTFDDFSISLNYSVGGKQYLSSKLDNEHYAVSYTKKNGFEMGIIPKTYIYFNSVAIKFKRQFSPTEKFFANGYQSWTTSREYSKGDREIGLTNLVKVLPSFKPLATISGDYNFRKYPTETGIFTSYTYAYIRDQGRVQLFGSLLEKTGFTTITANFNDDTLVFARDIEGVTSKERVNLFNIELFEGSYNEVFDNYFSYLDIPQPRISKLCGYTSWYNYFQKIDENIILRDLNALDEVKDQVNIFQIDDGYETFVGDWLDKNPKFPNGMKYICDKIHDKGYLAGIWLAPFNVQRKSRTAKEHPDWLIKNKKGKPTWGCAGWGGAYTLDIYIPAVRDHIKHFFDVILNEWGYDMVKLDFLYSQCMNPRNGKTRGEIMSDAMLFLRECVGEKLILGCGVPLGSAFGLVDACRISCDVDLSYSDKIYNKLHINCEIPSAKNAITNTIFRRHLNNRAFINDPDVFFLRDFNLNFTKNQKLLLSKINSLFGSVLFVSDDVGKYGVEEISVLKKAFTSQDVNIISAEFTNKENILIRYTTSGDEKIKTLSFDLNFGDATGELFNNSFNLNYI